jgi:hypothetical protein
MKKTFVLLGILLCVVSEASAGPSYYGLSGFAFLPTAHTGPPWSHGISVSSFPAAFETLEIYPFSIRAYLTIANGIEIGVTNTYRYYADSSESYGPITLPGGGFLAGSSTTYAPLVPSVKFAFLDTAVPNGSIAVGFEYPFGVFAVVDYLLSLGPGLSFHFASGIASTFVTLSAFGGARAVLPFGFALSIEGAYTGKTSYLTHGQEAFLALDLSYTVTEGMVVDFVSRIDQDGSRRLSAGFHLDL